MGARPILTLVREAAAAEHAVVDALSPVWADLQEEIGVRDDLRTPDRALSTCVTLEDLAAEVGVDPTTIRRARMDPAKKHSRNPPPGWEAALARLARARAAELVKLAEDLEG